MNTVKWKTRTSYNEPNHAHELTFSTYKKHPFFDNPLLADCFCEKLFEAAVRQDFKVWAFVVMPNHCHLLIHPNQAEYQISAILKSIKLPVSRACFELSPEIRESCRITRKSRPDEFQFWMPGGGYDRNLWTQEAVLSSIKYIHNNPVKRGLVQVEMEWKWSSAACYNTEVSPWDVEVYGH